MEDIRSHQSPTHHAQTGAGQTAGSQPAKKQRRRPSKKALIIAGVVILVLAVGFFVVQYIKTKNELAKVKDQDTASQTEAKELSDKLGKYLELPQDETPTIATITEKEKLAGQPFFNGAENGDKVLVYVNSEKAILYRPSTNKIISYAPVNLTGNESTSVEQSTEQ